MAQLGPIVGVAKLSGGHDCLAENFQGMEDW